METHSTDVGNFAISLRLWSDTIPLEDLGEQLGLRVDHLHMKGQPKLLASGLSKHPALTHFLGVESFETSDIRAIEEWFERVLSSMDAVPELKNRLLTQEVTGSIVMALFPNDQYQDLNISVKTIQRAEEMRVAIELEDYLNLVDGNPGYKKIV